MSSLVKMMSEHNIIPPSPSNESQSIFHEQGVLPHRNPASLLREQGTSHCGMRLEVELIHREQQGKTRMARIVILQS